MGRPPKERVEDEVEEGNFGCDNVELFDSTVRSTLKGDILGDVCEPKGCGCGSLKLDMAATVAFPQGFIYEIYAQNAVGKTTLALEIEGQAQQKGHRVAYLDLEGTLNKTLVASIRTLDVNKKDAAGQPLWIYKEGLIRSSEKEEDVRVMTGEEAFKYVITYCSMFKNAYIVVDSVDSITPAAILEGKEVGEASMGTLAKLMSDAMRRLHGICKKNNNTAIFINQVRDSLTMYGDPEATPGGKALRFYAFQRIKLSRQGKAANLLDENGKIIGHTVKAEIKKNKLPSTQDSVEFNLIYGKGIDREQEMIDFGMMFDVLKVWKEPNGKELKSMLDIEGNKIRATAASKFLHENPEIAKVVEEKVRKVLEV